MKLLSLISGSLIFLFVACTTHDRTVENTTPSGIVAEDSRGTSSGAVVETEPVVPSVNDSIGVAPLPPVDNARHNAVRGPTDNSGRKIHRSVVVPSEESVGTSSGDSIGTSSGVLGEKPIEHPKEDVDRTGDSRLDFPFGYQGESSPYAISE